MDFELQRNAFGRLVLTNADGATHVGVVPVRRKSSRRRVASGFSCPPVLSACATSARMGCLMRSGMAAQSIPCCRSTSAIC